MFNVGNGCPYFSSVTLSAISLRCITFPCWLSRWIIHRRIHTLAPKVIHPGPSVPLHSGGSFSAVYVCPVSASPRPAGQATGRVGAMRHKHGGHGPISDEILVARHFILLGPQSGDVSSVRSRVLPPVHDFRNKHALDGK